MLILTRREGESIIIETPAGERITVTVLGVKGSQFQRGFKRSHPATQRD